ncbi:MAG: hypothetical protein QXT77_00115 [Candidatus Methanomethylicaceae archaeon]
MKGLVIHNEPAKMHYRVKSKEMVMRIGKGMLTGLLILAVAALPPKVGARQLGKAVARGAARSAGRVFRRVSITKILRRDLQLHRRTPLRPLARPRRVFRYTSLAQARREVRKGILRGRHMTARARPGRPLTAAHAQQRFALPRKPRVRMTIQLPQGLPVRVNRVSGASRSWELTAGKRIRQTAIKKIVRLR